MDQGDVSVNGIYDRIAVDFEIHATDGLYNAHLDRPAVLDLCGDVSGADVLDIGCGPGLYAEALLARGARRVTGLDASEEMVRLARLRLGARAEIMQHDADDPLAHLGEDQFDLVVCALMIHYVNDRRRLYRDMHRVLRQTGALVVSTQHPTADWLRHGGSYFVTERVTERWPVAGGVEMQLWRMPLTVVCAELTESGFMIDRLVEPVPTSTGEEVAPDDFARLHQAPSFLAIRCVPR